MRNQRPPEGVPTAGPERTHRRHRLRVRTLLLLVVLVPAIGMVAVSVNAARGAIAERDASVEIQEDADVLVDVVNARTNLAGEETVSAVLAVAADLGVDAAQLLDLYDIDYLARLAEARAAVDADPTLQAVLTRTDGHALLQSLREEVDDGEASFEEVQPVFGELTTGIDEVLRDRLDRLEAGFGYETTSGSLHERLDALRATVDALTSGSRRASLSIELLQIEPDPAALEQLLDATSRHRAATERLTGRLGPAAEQVQSRLEADPAIRRFERTLDDLAATFLTGQQSPLATDPTAFGEAFVDGEPWGVGLSDMVRAAASDLDEGAALHEESATRALRNQTVLAVLLIIISMTGALLLARSVARPIRRLEAAAGQIHQGRFDLEPLETTGPRELADTAAAFNDMAVTLASVESHAVALADEPEAPLLDHQLPGRTGQALQVALNRLRASIRSAEQIRRELEVAATHDGLTGLLNRTATLAMIEHDLARMVRVDGVVMALFIDLDGFKSINDEHGHAAGDDALRLTAEALRITTRQADVVGRFGGDEFLVAGVVDDTAEVEGLAARIRDAVTRIELAGRAGPIPLRCSIGMAVSDSTTTVDELVSRADAGLYVAKRLGRDQAGWDDRRDVRGITTGDTRGPRPR